MTDTKKRLRLACAAVLLLVMLGTLLAYFIVPTVADARTRAMLGDEDAVVTDTARSPWIYTDDRGVFYLYPEKFPLWMDTLVIPDAVNGYACKSFSKVNDPVLRIKTVVLPKTVSFIPDKYGMFNDWMTLETVVFAEGSTELVSLKFGNVPAIKEIYLPRTLTSLRSLTLPSAREDCVVIHFGGTEAEWLLLGGQAKEIAEKYTVRYESAYSK